MRNRLNHFILNRLLIVRYRARKSTCAVKCILAIESLFAKSGILFYGKNNTGESATHDGSKGGTVLHG